jgi:high-affinity Fe2+/Pb2+ permease
MIPFRAGRNHAASRQAALAAAPGAGLPVRGAVLRARSAVSIAMLVAAVLSGALGLVIFLTERGVANEIKGFVLMLIAAVLAVGGCVLWELRAIRRKLEGKDQR